MTRHSATSLQLFEIGNVFLVTIRVLNATFVLREYSLLMLKKSKRISISNNRRHVQLTTFFNSAKMKIDMNTAFDY